MQATAMTYHYRIFDLMLVQELFRHKPQLRPDRYVNDAWNGEQDAIRQALVEGYRWTRSEDTLAIFERPTSTPPPCSMP